MIEAPSQSLFHRDPTVDIGGWIAEHWPRRSSRQVQHIQHRGLLRRDYLDFTEGRLHQQLDEQIRADGAFLQLYREVRWCVLPNDDWSISSHGPTLEMRGIPMWRPEIEAYLARRPDVDTSHYGVLCTVEALTIPTPPPWGGDH